MSVSQTNSPPPEAAAACFASGPRAAEHQTLATTNSGSVIGGHGEEDGGPEEEEGFEEGGGALFAAFGRSDRASLTRRAESRPQVSSVAPSTLTETLVIWAEWRFLTSETHLPDFVSLWCVCVCVCVSR